MAIINGTDGDDVLLNVVGESDTIDGGAGTDTVSYAGAGGGAGILVDLSLSAALDLGNGDFDTLESIENVIGSAFDDVIKGDDFANVLDGAAGGDNLFGGAGTDTASYASASLHGATVDLSAGTASDDGTGAIDFLTEIENLMGSAFADSLTGDDLANALDGGAGNDTLQGGAGNDTLTGGLDADVFKYSFDFTQGGGGGEPFSFTEFFADHGGAVTEDGKVAEGTKQGQFSSLYTQWLEMLVRDHGLGTDVLDLGQNAGIDGTPVIENMTGEFGERESFTWNSGGGKKTVTHERWYSDTWTSDSGGGQDSVASGDGFDTIVDFNFGVDQLEFNGLGADFTVDQFTSLFDVTQADVNGDNITDTVLSLTDNSWSVTLLDVSGHTEADFHGASLFS